MSLTISLPDDIATAIEDLAARNGMTPERLILDALGAHFPPIPRELQAEFDALEHASDEDYVRFEAAEQDFDAGSRTLSYLPPSLGVVYNLPNPYPTHNRRRCP